MEFVSGGITRPKGFLASGVYCGLRKNKTKKDLGLIYSETECSAFAVYTSNKVFGAPITITRNHLKNNKAKACVVNSGNANTCNIDGEPKALRMCEAVANELKLNTDDVLVASTGVIGQPLDIEAIESGVPELVETLAADGNDAAAEAILTTDTVKKEFAIKLNLDGKDVYIGMMAKGSGMIHPNMATMLVFITTDAAISPQMLNKALKNDVVDTFNMVSVDGDTSTNDMAAIMANGLAGNAQIQEENEDYMAFCGALKTVTTYLCRMIAKDGEGATKLLTANVSGAKDDETAKKVAKSVICSSLFKAAIFGADANWGRVLCAIGYSGADVDVQKVDVGFASKVGSIIVCKNGAGVPFDEDTAKSILTADEIDVNIALNRGTHTATAWGCDLTYDYVKINGDYRS